ncbi:MAG: acyltransferase family protein [Pseudomonadota bacterium]
MTSIKRNSGLDYAKGFGILIVVLAHLWRGLGSAGIIPTDDLYYAVSSSCTMLSMPLFFFASGLLYGRTAGRDSALNSISSKFDAIAYPYFIWSIIFWGVELLFSPLKNTPTEPINLLTLLWQPRHIFWFLYALFASFVIAAMLVKFIGERNAKPAAIFTGLILLMLYPFKLRIFAANEISMSFIYFAIGLFASSYFFQINIKSNKAIAIGATIATAMVIFTYHWIFKQRSFSYNSITPNATLTTVVVLGLTLTAAMNFPETGLAWLEKLGSRSMDIYLLHLLFVPSSRMLITKLLGAPTLGVYIFTGMLVGIGGPLITSNILRKIGAGFLFAPPKALSMKALAEHTKIAHP